MSGAAMNDATTRDLPAEDAVFALYDGDYHLGLGALVNSLYRAGFRGAVYAGYRGALPPWAAPTTCWGPHRQYNVAEGCAIRFIAVDYEGHLTNYKARFILSTIEAHCPGVERIFYFDVDIVVKARWGFFRDWADCGVALCQDVNEPNMSANHPVRKYWRELAAGLDLECRKVDGYFNGGFVGLRCEHFGFLETWRALLDRMHETGVSAENFHFGDRTHPFMAMDQDALNITVMARPEPISSLDNSAMDVSRGGYVMSHALHGAKPWRRRYLLDALRGYPPDKANKGFWDNVEAPIAVVAPGRRRLARVGLRTGAAIGRFYRRT